MIRKFFSAIVAIFALYASAGANAQTADTLFPYPQASEDMGTLTEKCNYLVYNFWDRCNLKQSFSTLKKLDDAFGTWASFMPYAAADTVHMAIDNFIGRMQKEAPKNLPEIGDMAQKWFYCDSAEIYSEELYTPFCRAVATSKKVPNATKARYAAQLKILENSSVGSILPDFSFVTPSGEKMDFGSIRASRIILFFNDPDCFDCTLAKARLSADYNTKRLVETGLVKVVSIYPDSPSEEWKEAADGYPENWIVGASDSVDEYFDLSEMPAIYWTDGKHKVIGKNLPVDNVIYMVEQIQAHFNQ